MEKHFDEMVNSLRKLKKLITDEPTQHHAVAVGVHALVADHPIPPEAAVVAALTTTQDVPPDPQSTPLAEHVTATAATFLSTVHKSTYPDSPTPDVHIEVSSSENEQASADGLVRDDTLWLDLWLPTYRDPLDPKHGEDADWRRWQQPDDPPVLDILARHDDGRPDTVLALRALPEDSGLMVVDADATVDWSGSSPVIRWARTNDRDETAWQAARTHRGRAAADTEHPPAAA